MINAAAVPLFHSFLTYTKTWKRLLTYNHTMWEISSWIDCCTVRNEVSVMTLKTNREMFGAQVASRSRAELKPQRCRTAERFSCEADKTQLFFLVKLKDLTWDQTHTCRHAPCPSSHYPEGTRDLFPLSRRAAEGDSGIDHADYLPVSFSAVAWFALSHNHPHPVHLFGFHGDSVISSAVISC